jgi:acyl-CoA oxidase
MTTVQRVAPSAAEKKMSEKLNLLLEKDNRDTRQLMRELFKHPAFIPRFDISLASQRELALERLRKITENHCISVLDFENNPLNIFAGKFIAKVVGGRTKENFVAHEIAGINDGSFATKMTVQFNLFGGTIIKLGTERHRWLLNGIDSLQDIGCFALTELGYGNNAVEMETTAVYDHSKKEIMINTPSTLAQKYWITNSAGCIGDS